MPDIRGTPGTGVTRNITRNLGNQEFGVLRVTCRSAIPESPGNPGSRSHPGRRVHGVTELPGTSGSRSHPEAQDPEVTLAVSPGRESPETTGSRSPRKSVSLESPGTPCSRCHPELQVPEL